MPLKHLGITTKGFPPPSARPTTRGASASPVPVPRPRGSATPPKPDRVCEASTGIRETFTATEPSGRKFEIVSVEGKVVNGTGPTLAHVGKPLKYVIELFQWRGWPVSDANGAALTSQWDTNSGTEKTDVKTKDRPRKKVTESKGPGATEAQNPETADAGPAAPAQAAQTGRRSRRRQP